MEIVQAIKRSANQYFNPDTLLGYGIPFFSTAYTVLSIGEVNFPNNESLHVYPNPAVKDNTINAYYFSTSKDKIQIVLSDASGRILMNESTVVNAGYSSIVLPKLNSSGMYFLNIQSEKINVSKRFIVK
jgi:hypothetical protein